MMKGRCHAQSGFALLLVLMVVAAAAILGVSYLLGASMHLVGSSNLVLAVRARYLAESGLEHSLYVLQIDAELLENSTEANQLGPFYVDGSDDRYTFYAAPGAGIDNIYTVTATGFCKGMKQSASFTVYSPNLFAGLVASHGPVAYWRLGELSGTVAQDVTGVHNGVYVNGITLSQVGALIGANNTAAHFDGFNDYVDTGSWDVDAAAMTLMGWFKGYDFSKKDQRIISKGKRLLGPHQYWMLGTAENDGKIRLRFRMRTSKETVTLDAASGDILAGEWVFAVAVYDGADMILYKDGVEVGRLAKTGAVDGHSQVPVWIGGHPTDATATPWNGLLDEVAVFDRALTAEQVVELYAARRPRPGIVQWHD